MLNNFEQIALNKTLTNDEIQRYLFRLVEELNYRLDITQETTIIQESTPEPEPIDFDAIYPVGSIYMSVNDTSPETLFGGTWEQIKDTFLLSAGDTYTAGATGGEAIHILTTDEMPAHTHGSKSLSGKLSAYTWSTGSASGIVTKETPYQNMNMYGGSDIGHNTYTIDATHEHTSVGNGTAHNNMPPYLVVHVWKRTA